MKILHTSDWHLGKTLYGRRCHSEFGAFLDWLALEIEQQHIDCLVIAGDIFDTTTPANSTQSLYYSFLHRVAGGCCRHIVIIGGNHDSPSLLNAPRQLLQHLNVTVIGCATDDTDDEVILLRDPDGAPEALVCAVPYLRDRDVRTSLAGESLEDKADKLIRGIADHYTRVAETALSRREKLDADIPLIATGHLFTAGGTIAAEEDIRELYIGSLAHFPAALFPQCFDYIALGHLHIAQEVGGMATRRYSGSPLQLSFSQRQRSQSVAVVDFADDISVDTITVPSFLQLKTISGDRDAVMAQLDSLVETCEPAFIEVQYTGNTSASLYDDISSRVEDSAVELIRVVNRRLAIQAASPEDDEETLEELSVHDVFRRCLEEHQVDVKAREELEFCFNQIVRQIDEDDGGEEP